MDVLGSLHGHPLGIMDIKVRHHNNNNNNNSNSSSNNNNNNNNNSHNNHNKTNGLRREGQVFLDKDRVAWSYDEATYHCLELTRKWLLLHWRQIMI